MMYTIRLKFSLLALSFGAFALSCSGPSAEFLGYTEGTSCRNAIGLEEDRGGVLVETTRDVEGLQGLDGYQLLGALFGEPVTVFIGCVGDRLDTVSFVSKELTESEADRLEQLFREEVDRVYPMPEPEFRYYIGDSEPGGAIREGATPMDRHAYLCADALILSVAKEYPRANREGFIVVLGLGLLNADGSFVCSANNIVS